MTTTDLHAILDGPKHIEWLRDEQDPSAGLRLLITDPATNSVGILAIEPMALVLPYEVVLDYSWHELSTELGRPPAECLIDDLKTNVDPAYLPGDVPFLFDNVG